MGGGGGGGGGEERVFLWSANHVVECISRVLFIFTVWKQVQSWNTGFYPLNKTDIFTGGYFHTVKIFIVWK